MNLNKQLHILQSNQGPLVLIGYSEPPFKPDVALKNPNGVQVRVTTSWFMGRDWRINNIQKPLGFVVGFDLHLFKFGGNRTYIHGISVSNKTTLVVQGI